MTAEEAIKIMIMAFEQADMRKSQDPQGYRFGELANAYALSIAALRAQQEAEKNEPLTLEELREIDGEPVWVTELSIGIGYWALIMDDATYDGLYLTRATKFSDYGSYALYGKTWLAYRHKPKEGTK